MSELKVSIVIPAKNTAKFLPECLESIISQSYSNWEALVVDDGSTDNSVQIVSDFAKKDHRIRLLTNSGTGIIDALKTAYAVANGKLITRMDSDDIMTSDKLLKMSTMLKTYGKGHVALGLVKYFSKEGLKDGYKRYEKWLNRLTKKGGNFNEIYKECVIPSPCWMVYTSDFERCEGFKPNIYPEDYDLAFRFFKYGLKCIPSNEVFHHWRDYAIRTSRTSEHYAENSFLELKLHYFMELSYDPSKTLIIWGAGTKGKKMAKLLSKATIPFEWICDNPKKIGKEIYGKTLQPFESLSKIEDYQSIITVANREGQDSIKTYFDIHQKKAMKDYFFFC
jgi:glycosyltransferase involved in cell wall biosynthesis